MASDRMSVTLTAETPTGTSVDRRGRCVWVLHSPDTTALDRRVPLPESLEIGREPTGGRHGLALVDPRVSRRHAVVRQRGGLPIFEVRDLGSRNGTFVNGQRVEQETLTNGDLLRVGDTLLEFGPSELSEAVPDSWVVGSSFSLGRVLADLERAAGSELPVLLLGEAGVGKSLLARWLHERSGRVGPFVPVNCGAIPSELVESYLFGHRKGAFTGATTDVVGVFEKARGGTLFLDEIGSLPLMQQPKLLRVLESREFSPVGFAGVLESDARVAAATNADLLAAVADGRFRHDLYTRLAGFMVRVPSLRERRADIPRLLTHFQQESGLGPPVEWTADALERLLVYDWPGNVRELRFLTQRLSLLDDFESRLELRHLAMLLPELLEGGPSPGAATEGASPLAALAPSPGADSGVAGRRTVSDTDSRRPSREALEEALAIFKGNITRLGYHFGKDPKQIYRWLAFYNLDPGDFRQGR
jgi:DNA-binding NtrC family response regulator